MRCIHARREGVETRYIVRTLVQNLRVNANWRSIIGPLARAVIMHRDGAGAPKAALDAAAAAALDAFHTCPSLDLLVPALVEGGIEEMRRRCSLTPGELQEVHNVRAQDLPFGCARQSSWLITANRAAPGA